MPDPDDRVRAVATVIPRGEVMTYGEIGALTGLHPRHVGQVVSRIADDIPWWRIVRADGTPAACHGGSATTRLQDEGVPFAGTRVASRSDR